MELPVKVFQFELAPSVEVVALIGALDGTGSATSNVLWTYLSSCFGHCRFWTRIHSVAIGQQLDLLVCLEVRRLPETGLAPVHHHDLSWLLRSRQTAIDLKATLVKGPRALQRLRARIVVLLEHDAFALLCLDYFRARVLLHLSDEALFAGVILLELGLAQSLAFLQQRSDIFELLLLKGPRAV